MALALNLVSTITPEGYAAATGNVPNANGFRIEITKIQPVVNGVPKGFFPATGKALGGGQVRVRATIASATEEYNFNELWIYDGISNAVFCKVKRADGGNLDFVSPYKKSVVNYNIKFSTLPANTVTIVADNGQSLALAELDAHIIASDPHPQYLLRGTKPIADWNAAITNGKYMGAGAVNAPYPTDWCIGEVTAHNDGWVTQYVTVFTRDTQLDSLKFRRDCNNWTWNTWTQILETKAELDARFLDVAGNSNMSGSLNVKSGTGLNAGIKGDADTDTGIEWLSEGVIQTVINGVVRQKSDGGTTQIMSGDKRFEYQSNGNIATHDASNNVIWSAFNTYQKNESDARYLTIAQRNIDAVSNDATFVNVAGDTMTGVLRAKGGTGLNAGLKGDADADTGLEWLSEGVLQTVINGVVRQKSDGGMTQIMSGDKRFEYQSNGNIASYDASNNPIWSAFNTYQKNESDARYLTIAQRNIDAVSNDATFVNVAGDTMTGVLRAKGGTGLNAGLKGDADTDTGLEWLSEGVLQTVINGVVRQKSDGGVTQIMSGDKRFEYQSNGNIASYDASNNPIWSAFNTYQKTDYSGSVGSGWYRTPHPSIATGIIKQWGTTTAMGQDSTLAVSFPIAFPNACNFVVLTESGAIDFSGSGSMSVDSVTNSGFTIRKGTDVSHAVRWVAEGY